MVDAKRWGCQKAQEQVRYASILTIPMEISALPSTTNGCANNLFNVIVACRNIETRHGTLTSRFSAQI